MNLHFEWKHRRRLLRCLVSRAISSCQAPPRTYCPPAMPFRDDNLVCIELGSYETRSTFGLAESLGPPKTRTRTRVGKRKGSDAYICGDDLSSTLANGDGTIDVIYPLVVGYITDWEALTAFLKNLIYTLTKEEPGSKESDIPVVLIVPPQWSTLDRERITKLAMEEFLRPAFMIIDTAAASLYACNSMTGLVIDVGYEKTDITSIIDSTWVPSSSITVPLGGRHLTDSFVSFLRSDRPLDQATQTPIESHEVDYELAETIKLSQICEVQVETKTPNVMAFQADAPQTGESEEGVLDIAAVVASGKTREYLAQVQAEKAGLNGTAQQTVPNAQLTHNTLTIGARTLVVGRDRFKLGDVLLEETALTDAIWNSIMSSAIDPSRRHELWENIVIVGGGAKVKGFRDRLMQALQARYGSVLTQASTNPYDPALYGIYPTTIRAIKIPIHFPEWNSKDSDNGQTGVSEEATFLGGCIIAHIAFASSETGSARLYITKADYNDRGAALVTSGQEVLGKDA